MTPNHLPPWQLWMRKGDGGVAASLASRVLALAVAAYLTQIQVKWGGEALGAWRS